MDDDAVSGLLGDLDYPMAIVTVGAGGERSGCLVGFLSQCSIDPPSVMAWISVRNHTFRVATTASAMAVHFPGRDQLELAELFGGETGDETDKFARCRWHEGPMGVPLLDDCSRWFVGVVAGRFPTGDHVGHLLFPVAAARGEWAGQLPFRAVQSIEPGHPA